MARGIVGTLQLLGTVVLAAPLALLGVQFLLSGRELTGALFVVLAAAMIALEEYLTTPQDVPAKAAERAVGSVVDDDDPDR
ncbi:hypothetical protein BRC94_04110 [Halobacteriales archaeon QS_5_70_17]|nr:MAG: hypothetical protein BRC94_04110 [Halobacteriales archaeon QS_5_70_17]